jgi:hypothetical protein
MLEGWEVAVDGADGDARALCDVLHAGRQHSALAVACTRGLEDPLSRLFHRGGPLPHLVFSLSHLVDEIAPAK